MTHLNTNVFFFKDPATTEIYPLSLHDALPISSVAREGSGNPTTIVAPFGQRTTLSLDGAGYLSRIANPAGEAVQDRKSTRLNSSHANISYAVFCLKKKKKTN